MDSFREKDFTFPDCWKDDLRMDSLFSPFKPRVVNPSNYDSKMNFWSCLIEDWCLYKKTPFVSLPVLMLEFKRNNKSPSCLGEVINQLQRDKTLIVKDAFDQMTEASWAKWAMQVMISNPLKSTFNVVKNMIVKNNGDFGDNLLHLPVIRKLGEEVIHNIPENYKGNVLSIKEVQELCGFKKLEFLEIILNHLSSMKLIAICKFELEILVKFPKQGSKDLRINEVDKAIYSLVEKQKFLEKNLAFIDEKRKQLINEARKQVAAKNQSMAKSFLKRALMIKNHMLKINDGITNIESLIYQMRMTEMDSVIMDCYQTGSKSLKKFLEDNNLTEENIEKVRTELENCIALSNDLDEAISSSPMNNYDNELNEELKKLLIEDEPKEELKFPDIPTADPSNNVEKELEKRLVDLTI